MLPNRHDQVIWRKSSRSGDNAGNCVEVAAIADAIAVRDSKLNTTGDFPYLTVPVNTWNAMISSIKAT